jgi:hypothetical protein
LQSKTVAAINARKRQSACFGAPLSGDELVSHVRLKAHQMSCPR